MTYSEKLKDPRWQKKRLEILNRDEFKCQHCLDEESTLNVHHISYSEGEPWEIENKLLLTLCKNCHEHETEAIKLSSRELIMKLKNLGFEASHFYQLSEYLHGLNRDQILEYFGKCEYEN